MRVFPIGLEGWEAAGLKTSPPEREGAYRFGLKAVDGELVELGGYEGKAILIRTIEWRGDRGKVQVSELEEIHGKWGKQGLVVLGVLVGEKGTSAEMKEYVKQSGASFPILGWVEVEGEKAHGLFKSLGGRKGQEDYLVGRDGKGVSVAEGVEKALEGALKESK